MRILYTVVMRSSCTLLPPWIYSPFTVRESFVKPQPEPRLSSRSVSCVFTHLDLVRRSSTRYHCTYLYAQWYWYNLIFCNYNISSRRLSKRFNCKFFDFKYVWTITVFPTDVNITSLFCSRLKKCPTVLME